MGFELGMHLIALMLSCSGRKSTDRCAALSGVCQGPCPNKGWFSVTSHSGHFVAHLTRRWLFLCWKSTLFPYTSFTYISLFLWCKSTCSFCLTPQRGTWQCERSNAHDLSCTEK